MTSPFDDVKKGESYLVGELFCAWTYFVFCIGHTLCDVDMYLFPHVVSIMLCGHVAFVLCISVIYVMYEPMCYPYL